MIQTIDLLGGVTLHYFRDSRFKQNLLTLQLVCPMGQPENAMNALIPAVLLRGCRTAPDLRSITLRLDHLYGASVGALVRRAGDYQMTGLSCGFISDRYTLEGEHLLEPMVDFLRELLLEPVLEDGCFRTDYVESEKKNLIAAIEAQRNDKRAYAANQMIKKMCGSDPFGLPRLGEAEDVAAITPKSLYAHYKTLLSQSRVELFYVGDREPEEVAKLLTLLFRDIPRNYTPLLPQTALRPGAPGEHTETADVAQGKLCMGFTTPITNRSPDFVPMQICNVILGAGMTSKLFMQIREKLSLCYDIGSGYYGSKGLLTVSAGIDWNKQTQVRQEILRQLDACAKGEITPEELQAAKESLSSGLRSTLDSPGAIENYFFLGMLNGMDMTPAQHMEKINGVTAADVARVAKTIQLHTQYLLKGEE